MKGKTLTDPKPQTFKNFINGTHNLTNKTSVLSLIKYQQNKQEHAFFVWEICDGIHIYLYKIQLVPQLESDQVKLAYQPISLVDLQKIPTNAKCQIWDVSTTKGAILEKEIAKQIAYVIRSQADQANILYFSEQWNEPNKKRLALEWCRELLQLVQLPIGQWIDFKIHALNQKVIREKPVVLPSLEAASSSSTFFASSSSSTDSKVTYTRYGENSLQKKDYSVAIKQFDEVLKLDANYLRAKQGKAQALLELGILAYNNLHKELALQNFQAAFDLMPENTTIKESLLLAQQKLLPPAVRVPLAVTQKFPAPIENLIFQGGGIKGLAYVGDLEELLSGDYEFYLENIKRVGGTSAGAITALGLGLGYSLAEIKDIMIKTPFSNFFDGEYRDVFLDLNERGGEVEEKLKEKLQGSKAGILGRVAGAYFSDKDVAASKQGIELLTEEGFGLFLGESLRNWFEELIRLKTGGVKQVDGSIVGGIEHATFRELYELQQTEPTKYPLFKELYFVGVNLTLSQVEVFSHEHTPDVIVSDALRCSMSIPVVFKAHHVFIKNAATDFQRRQDPKQHLYVDGGILSNCPIWLFDDARYITGSSQSGHQINPHTLAFMLADPEQHSHLEQNTRLTNEIPNGIIGYLKQLVNCIFDNSERQIPTIDNRQRTIFVDNKGVKTTEFNLTPFKRDYLLLSGKQSVETYFNRLAREASMVMKPQIYPIYFAYLNPAQRDAEDNTLLHTAIKQADCELVRYLCTERIAAIDKTACNQAGETVMDLALKQSDSAQQAEIVKLLMQLEFPKTATLSPTL